MAHHHQASVPTPLIDQALMMLAATRDKRGLTWGQHPGPTCEAEAALADQLEEKLGPDMGVVTDLEPA